MSPPPTRAAETGWVRVGRYDGALHRRLRRATRGHGGRDLARRAGVDRGAAVRLRAAGRPSRPERRRALPARRRPHGRRASPRRRHLPRRRHRLASPRRVRPRRHRVPGARPRVDERHLLRRRPHRVRPAVATAPRCRSASSASRSTPRASISPRRVVDGGRSISGEAAGRFLTASSSAAEHRAGARAAESRSSPTCRRRSCASSRSGS